MIDTVSSITKMQILLTNPHTFCYIYLNCLYFFPPTFYRRRHIAEEREKAEIPSFGPTIIPEPETSTLPTPVGKYTTYAIFQVA